MTLNEYQEKAMETCMPTSENFTYMMLNLVGEVGEFASKVAKAIRKDMVCISDNEYIEDACYEENEEYNRKLVKDLKKEAGDILWQLSGLCDVMDWTLEDIAQQNLDKLASRQDRGVIDGSGDNR